MRDPQDRDVLPSAFAGWRAEWAAIPSCRNAVNDLPPRPRFDRAEPAVRRVAAV